MRLMKRESVHRPGGLRPVGIGGRCRRGKYLGAGPSPSQARIPTDLAHEAAGVQNELVLLETCSVTENTWRMAPFQVPLPTIDEYVGCGTW